MTAPADTIRQAATLIRSRAEAARTSASGRWYVATPQGGYPQTIDESGSATLIAQTFDGPQHVQATAPFIAAMDPTVALALADLLDYAAECSPGATRAHALRIARTILGTDPAAPTEET